MSEGTSNELSIEEASERLAKRDLRSVDLVRDCLGAIERTDGAVGSFLEVTADLALAQAAAADERLDAGKDVRPLTGIPIALKDLFVTEGVRTTCASKMLENFVPRYNGTAVARLHEAGAVLVGKLNMDEFAMGSSCENSALGKTRNPWDLGRVAGGSSGGSATAVAAGQVLGTLGTDTGGSIRLPASYCGVVGMKPTYGRVSRFGVVAFASSLDQVGPLARTTRGAAALLECVAGHDRRDMTSLDAAVPAYTAELGPAGQGGLEGLRVGIPAEYFTDGIEPDVDAAVHAAIEQLVALGATTVPVSLPHTEYAVATYYLVATAEASSNLGRYDGVRYGLREGDEDGLQAMYGATRDAGFGDEVKRRILLGTYALSAGYYDAYYGKAMKARTLIRSDFDAAFANVDVLAMPTSPGTAFEVGARTADPLSMYLSDILTIPANLAGLPCLSLPCGLDGAGLPIGLQLVGPTLGETALLRAAAAFEDSTEHWRHRPAFAGPGN